MRERIGIVSVMAFVQLARRLTAAVAWCVRRDQVEYVCAVFAVGETELEPGGMDREVTGSNREEWRDKVLEFYLSRSVEKQRLAVRRGFSRVLPLREVRAL